MRRAAARVLVLASLGACSSSGSAPEPGASSAASAGTSAPAPGATASAEVHRGPPAGDAATRRVAALDLLDGALGGAALPLEATDDGGPIDLGLHDELNPPGGPGRVGFEGVSVSGAVPPERVTQALEARADRVRGCYDRGRAVNPSLSGDVGVGFVVSKAELTSLRDAGSDLPDSSVIRCVVEAHRGLALRGPDDGICTVSVRWQLRPPGE